MSLPDIGVGNDGIIKESVTPDTLPPPPAEVVLALCRRIAARLPKHAPGNSPFDDRLAVLAGFSVPFTSPDSSGRCGHGWPGNRLTSDDVRKLNILSNHSGLPCNELIHVAVGLLYANTRDLVLHLLAVQEQTCLPFAEVADQVLATPADSAERPTELQVAALETTTTRHSHRPLPTVHKCVHHEASPADPFGSVPVMAAESSSACVAASPTSVPPDPMPRRRPTTPNSEMPRDDLDTLSEELRSLREEVRVLREAVDDFREAMEHTVRNLPDHLPPPLRIWSLPVDPTAPDFGERINAVPREQMEALRAAATRPVPPLTPPRTSGRQTRLF